MSIPNKKWLSLSLIAIVLPISLLTALKFGGVLVEPQQPETMTQYAVDWTMERPSYYTTIGHKFNNSYLTDEIDGEIGLYVQEYFENALTLPFGGRDGVAFGIDINTTILKGSGVSLAIKCHATNGNSTLYICDWDRQLHYSNVSIVEMKQIGGYDEAYIKASILSSPSFIQDQCYWTFNTDAPENHTLNVSLEVLYFNGVSYQKVVLPLNLSVISKTTEE